MVIRFLLGWIGLVSFELLVYALFALAMILAIYFGLVEFP